MGESLSGRNKITKNAAFLYLRMILVMVISLISVRLLLRSLGVEDYGLYNAIGGVVASFSFITSTLTLASQRFFSYELGKQDGDLKKVFNTIFIVYIIVGITLFLILIVGGVWFVEHKMTIPFGQLKTAKIILLLTALSFIITVLTNPFPALIIAKEEMSLYAYLSITDVIMKLIAVLLLLLPFHNKLIVYSLALFFVSFIYFIINYYICHKRYTECKFANSYEISLFKSVFSFSGWTLFGSVASMGYSQGFNVLLNVFIGPVANAAFAVSNQVANAISNLSSGFFSAVRPSFIRSFAVNDKQYSREIFDLSNKISFLLLSLISVPLILNTEIVLRLWLGEVHEYMVTFTRLICCAIIIQIFGMPLTTIAQGANIVKKYHLYVDGFTLIGLIIIYLIFRKGYNPYIALLAYVIIFIIAHIIRIIVTHKSIDLSIAKYFKSFILPAVLIYITDMVILWPLVIKLGEGSIWSLVINISFSTIYLIFMSYLILLTKAERQKINNIINEQYSKYFNKNRNNHR